MGGWWSSRGGEEGEEEETGSPTAFRYPSKTGAFFGSHFIMGGERFETPQPEQYLFGDNTDLNFLGSKPVPFPYPAPQSSEPTKTLKALINIRKETLKFVKVQPPPSTSQPSSQPSSPVVEGPKRPIVDYTIEFVFDSDCKCEITIMYFCIEEVNGNGVFYRPRNSKISSEPIRFKAGPNQVYSNSEHIFHPAEFPEQDLQFDFEREFYPVVIQCIALEGDEPRQSHTTTATVDKYSDGSYSIKPLKQKLFVDGLVYLMQEIYGIENKNASRKFDDDSEAENAAECVICMSDTRDTLILPCRHLCLCHACADSLRYQASNCPICRAPFRALLQVRAVYRIPPAPIEYAASLPTELPVVQMNVIPGYEMVPLLEALNGPYQPSELTLAAASLAARSLNQGDEASDIRPIAMTVMVAPLTEDLKDDKSPDEVTVIRESSGHRRKSSSARLSKSSSVDAKTPVISDPEDELHFAEAVETFPDLQDFGGADGILDAPVIPSSLNSHRREQAEEPSSRRSSKGSRLNSAASSKITSVRKPDNEEEEMELQSIEGSPIHSTNILMIAAIDEFSDEEDTSRTKRNASSQRMLSGDGFKDVADSAQSTPNKRVLSPLERDPSSRGNPDASSSPDPYFRFGGKMVPTSLPTTPNPNTASRLSHPGTGNSTSTRSSGDSFTSSSSTKQLLPSSTGVHHL